VKLYQLSRTDEVDDNEVASMVVAAEELWPARAIASQAQSDAVWNSPSHSTCIEIGTAARNVPAGVVLADARG
jgi:hypothetical protein